MSKKRTWLTRNLVVLSAVSLTQDAASELVYPLLPLFVTGVLAAPAVVLGITEGIAEVVAGLTKLLAGEASDRVGRRGFISAGYGLAGLGKVLVAGALAWPAVVAGRAVDRIGKGLRSTPRDAMIADNVDNQHLGRAFGFHRAADTAGAVIGPLVALIGLHYLDGNLRAVMWWAVLPAGISVALTFLVRESQPAIKAAKTKLMNLDLGTVFWRTSLPLVAVALINVPDTLLLLRLSALGATATQVVLAYVGFNLVYTLAAYPAGILADKLRPNLVYAIGLLAFAITYWTLASLEGQSWVMYAAVALYGFFPAFTEGVGRAMVSATVTNGVRGRAQGVFQSMSGIGVLLAGLWAGGFWEANSGAGSVPLAIAGTLSFVAALAFAGLPMRRQLLRTEREPEAQ